MIETQASAMWLAAAPNNPWRLIVVAVAVAVIIALVRLLLKPKGPRPRTAGPPWSPAIAQLHEHFPRWIVDPEWRERDRQARARKALRLDRRREWNLPVIDSPEDLMRLLGLREFRELVLLADANELAFGPGYLPEANSTKRLSNYHIRRIPKRGGGERVLCAPKPKMKAAQRTILREILDKVPAHPAAKAFRRGHDISHHAHPHIGRKVVAAFDLQDFFPTISKKRVFGFFHGLGYPASVAHVLSLLCTTRDCTGPRGSRRHLPQGAPTSPALANAICHRLDCRLTGLARRFGATYTRYADDLAFSGDEEFKRGLSRFIPLCEHIIRAERFRVNPKKRRFMRRGRLQRLTGLNVNDKVSLGRAEYDRLKAILHNARRAGSLDGQNRDNVPNFESHLRGRIAWVARFHAARGAKLRAQLAAVTAPSAPPPSIPPPE